MLEQLKQGKTITLTGDATVEISYKKGMKSPLIPKPAASFQIYVNGKLTDLCTQENTLAKKVKKLTKQYKLEPWQS